MSTKDLQKPIYNVNGSSKFFHKFRPTTGAFITPEKYGIVEMSIRPSSSSFLVVVVAGEIKFSVRFIVRLKSWPRKTGKLGLYLNAGVCSKVQGRNWIVK